MGEKKIAIMQPTFLPWAGYFNLIANVDDFVFLDDVQLEKQSWQTRNRLLIQKQPSFISLPIINYKLEQKINETNIFQFERNVEKITKTFLINYSKSHFFEDAHEIIKYMSSLSTCNLSEFNRQIIVFISNKLSLITNFHTSSDLNYNLKRTEKLIKICEHFESTIYISPVGSKVYLTEDNFVENINIKLSFQNYTPDIYTQNIPSFFSHLSILDTIANIGWEYTKEYIS
jgi:hypothetical protein